LLSALLDGGCPNAHWLFPPMPASSQFSASVQPHLWDSQRPPAIPSSLVIFYSTNLAADERRPKFGITKSGFSLEIFFGFKRMGNENSPTNQRK
jgi:hypothetical protein